MKTINFLSAGVGIAAAASLAFAFGGSGSRAQAARRLGARTPVLVELFTSEGCSSCPPADKLLAQLQRDQPVDGALIIPLSEHVDYWDGPQWRDPFSSAMFTNRQNAYVKVFGLDGPYTPQMVVDGRAQFVGSDEDSGIRAIAHAAKAQKIGIEVTASRTEGDGIGVDIKTTNTSGLRGGGTNDVFVAIAENNLSSHVSGGENTGRHLRHTAVVRSLQRVGSLGAAVPFEYTGKLSLKPDWKLKDLSVIAFIQSRSSGQILGSAIAGSL